MCQLFVGSNSAMWESETRSLRIDRMVTSVRLEAFFWRVLEDVAQRDGMTVTQLIARLYNESIEADHNLGNFTSFLRVCCGRYLSLQLSGDVPQDQSVSIQSLDAEQILNKERGNWQSAELALIK